MPDAMTWSRRCERCKRLTGVALKAAAGFAYAHCEACGQQNARAPLYELVEQLDAWIDAGAWPDGSTAWFARCAWACKLIRPSPRRTAAVSNERSE